MLGFFCYITYCRYSFGYFKSYGREQRTKIFENFINADKIIQKIENYQKQNKVSSGIRKRQKQNHNLSKGDFHLMVAKPFIHALIEEMKGAFNISNPPVLNVFLKLDPQNLPDRDSLSFESYGVGELKVFHDFYGTGKHNTIQGRMVQADALYDTQFSSLLLEFRNFKSLVSPQK